MTKKTQFNHLIRCYKKMYNARLIDDTEMGLVKSGKANFLASSAGHEGAAIFNELLILEDWLHCHYRDKPLMHARGIAPEVFFYTSLTKAEGVSYGRQMVIGVSAKKHNIVSVITPVGNQALSSVGIAHSIKNKPKKPIVYCGMGDGTTQQGEVLEAFAEAKRYNLPVLFVVQDNGLAISTRTQGKTFYSLPDNKKVNYFYDIPITYIDGTRPLEQFRTIKAIISNIRQTRSPQIIIFRLERLKSHSNADDHTSYRSEQELTVIAKADPIVLSREYLLTLGVEELTLKSLEEQSKKTIKKAIEMALKGSTPEPCFDAEKPFPKIILSRYVREYRGDFSQKIRLGMGAAMREVFRHRLLNDKNVYLLGEDIEDNKGDVFGVTRGLSTQFPGRVVNSPLAEATIVGVCIGMALTGKRPVAFMQFADFMPPAYNQIFTELSTMYWRSNGDWDCPVIIFAACGGYRPGLGPFHAQTNEATFAHIPGLDVYMPSNASDAAGMLNAAFDSGRPSIFLYPKKLLNSDNIEDTTSIDVDKQIIPVSKARIVKSGIDITLIGWGNTVSLCQEVASTLETVGIDSEVIDLRMIKPYDFQTIITSAEKTGRLIVTHEDNLTCGLGGEIISSVAEYAKTKVKFKRITRSDTYVPCNFENQLEVLPSYERILTAAAELLDLSLRWETVKSYNNDTIYDVPVIGPSPSDESILITEIYVKIGDEIKVGEKIVDIEASKSTGEILSPIKGIVEKIYVRSSGRATVGKRLIRLSVPKENGIKQKQPKKPILTRKIYDKPDQKNTFNSLRPVGISLPCFYTGSRVVKNKDLLENFPNHSSEDIINRTGIEQRFWLDDNENILDLAANAARDTLNKNQLNLIDIDMIICSTCTPDSYLSPSMACLILEKLYRIYDGEHKIPAFDINAACSAYLYGLQIARDYLQTRPSKRILLITAEYMTRRLDIKDFNTAFLFGDAATATIINGNNYMDESLASIDEVLLTTIAEDGHTLNIPASDTRYIQLKGKKLFTFAVRTMSMVMHQCCQKYGIALNKIDLMIPHQANQRISNAVEKYLKIKPGTLYSNINYYGNTSSCTIPIALNETLARQGSNKKIALCAFGSGFTAAAALITTK